MFGNIIFFIIGFLLDAFSITTILLVLTCSIPCTKKFIKTGLITNENSKIIYRQNKVTIIIHSILILITATITYIFFYNYLIVFFIGIIASFALSLSKLGMKSDNISDYANNYGKLFETYSVNNEELLNVTIPNINSKNKSNEELCILVKNFYELLIKNYMIYEKKVFDEADQVQKDIAKKIDYNKHKEYYQKLLNTSLEYQKTVLNCQQSYKDLNISLKNAIETFIDILNKQVQINNILANLVEGLDGDYLEYQKLIEERINLKNELQEILIKINQIYNEYIDESAQNKILTNNENEVKNSTLNWQRILEKFKKNGNMISFVAFMDTQLIELNKNTLEIKFKKEMTKFNIDIVEKEETKKILKQYILEETGHEWNFKYNYIIKNYGVSVSNEEYEKLLNIIRIGSGITNLDDAIKTFFEFYSKKNKTIPFELGTIENNSTIQKYENLLKMLEIGIGVKGIRNVQERLFDFYKSRGIIFPFDNI